MPQAPAWALVEGHGAKKTYDYSKAKETAFGKAADPSKAKRTIDVEMSDAMRFTPAQISRRGMVGTIKVTD